MNNSWLKRDIMANLGVPVKLLHESLGHIVTVELKTGEMYRGKLMEGESLRLASLARSAGRLVVLTLC